MWGRLVQVFRAALGSGAVFVPLDYLVSHMYTSDNHSYAAERLYREDLWTLDQWTAIVPYIFYAEVQFYKKKKKHNGPSNGHDVGLQARCRLCVMDRIRANACYTVLFCSILPDNLD